jgi:predicted amino acid racemase
MIKRYPRILIDIPKLKENAKTILDLCKSHHIETCFMVSKVLAGEKKAVRLLSDCGFTHIADSRIENLKAFQDIPLPKVLLRIPMISEAEKIVKYCNLSLNSELDTILALNKEAEKKNIIHQILLMFDLGDLREGIFYQDEYLPMIQEIINLSHIRLSGIGTNLTCYGGVIPTYEILMKLVAIKRQIETAFSIHLDIISGGNSSTIPLLLTNQLPNDINNLRIGEALFLGRETAYGTIIPNMHDDVFTVEAEIVELKEKPSYPIGEIGMNSFGEKPDIIDAGIQSRGIAAIGKQDIQLDNLDPIDKSVAIIGGSSDHLILNFSKPLYKVGDIVRFRVNYPGLLQAMTSGYVKKVFTK